MKKIIIFLALSIFGIYNLNTLCASKYKQECIEDSDCGYGGRCGKLGGSTGYCISDSGMANCPVGFQTIENDVCIKS